MKLSHLLGAVIALQGTTGLASSDIETLVVTASRVPEDGAHLPLAWSKIDEQALDVVSAVHPNEILQRVPGLWLSRGNGQESLLSLRSAVLTGAGSCGAFFTAEDGISLRAPGFCNVNQLFEANTEQAGAIEVIRGPATALFGSNAMHGVINLLTPSPTDTADAAIGIEGGPDGYARLTAHYSGTQGRHGIWLGAHGSHDGGYQDDAGYDQQKATFRHDYTGSVWTVSSVLALSNLNQETAGFIRGDKVYQDSRLRRTNPNPEAYRDAQSLRFHTRAQRVFNDEHTLSVTPYLRDNQMTFLQHFLPWQPVESNAHSSVGLQLSWRWTDDNWDWTHGIDWEYTDASLAEIQDAPFDANRPQGVHYDYQVDASNRAMYSQLRWRGAHAVQVDLGLRYEQMSYDYDTHVQPGAPCAPDAGNCRFYRPSDRRDSFSDISFNTGISLPVGSTQRAYLRAARGFRAPQATELYRLQSGQRSTDLGSEVIDNLELGWRGSLGERLSYQLAVYAMTKDNVIFQDSDRQTLSGARTRHRGLEASAQYQLGNKWRLAANLNLARHRYDNAVALLGSTVNLRGNLIDTAPKRFGSARLQRQLGWGTQGEAIAELEWVYLGPYYLDPDNAHRYKGHSLWNLRVAGDLSSNLEGALRLTNLTNTQYAERADFGFGQYRYFIGHPRGLYVELRYLWRR